MPHSAPPNTKMAMFWPLIKAVFTLKTPRHFWPFSVEIYLLVMPLIATVWREAEAEDVCFTSISELIVVQ